MIGVVVTGHCLRGEEYRDAESLLRKCATEREKFFQYSVAVEISGACPVADELFIIHTDSQSRLKLDFEYSRIGSHYVTVAQLHGRPDQVVIGETYGRAIHGSSTSSIIVKPSDRWNAPDRRMTELLVFDPRATGVLTAEEYAVGARYETAYAELRALAKRDSNSVARLNKDGFYEVFIPDSGLRIVFDQKRDFWPIEFMHSPPEANYSDNWQAKLGKVNDHHVPISATLSRVIRGRNDQQTAKQHVEFKFRWRSINRLIPTGERALENLKERLGVEIEQRGK